MDKFECYSILSRISSERGIDVSSYIKIAADSGPDDDRVQSFINRFDINESNSLYEAIYDRRRKNPLYKSLVNESSSIDDKAISLSSLLTQMSINMKSEGHRFSEAQMISEAVSKHLSGDSSMIEDVHSKVRHSIKEFVSNISNR